MIGACIVGVPLALLLISQSCANVRLKRQMIQYKKCEEQCLYLNVWILKKDISAGEKITRANLEMEKVWISELDYKEIITDIHQIKGKKAKIALKKGTVINDHLIDKKESKCR